MKKAITVRIIGYLLIAMSVIVLMLLFGLTRTRKEGTGVVTTVDSPDMVSGTLFHGVIFMSYENRVYRQGELITFHFKTSYPRFLIREVCVEFGHFRKAESGNFKKCVRYSMKPFELAARIPLLLNSIDPHVGISILYDGLPGEILYIGGKDFPKPKLQITEIDNSPPIIKDISTKLVTEMNEKLALFLIHAEDDNNTPASDVEISKWRADGEKETLGISHDRCIRRQKFKFECKFYADLVSSQDHLIEVEVRDSVGNRMRLRSRCRFDAETPCRPFSKEFRGDLVDPFTASGASSRHSSKLGQGRNCPGMELFVMRDRTGTSTHFKKRDGSVIELSSYAVHHEFSPNCHKFFKEDRRAETISFVVYEAISGKAILEVAGLGPQWASDSSGIYFSREEAGETKFQLWHFNLETRKSRKIAEVSDYTRCHFIDSAQFWYSVKVKGEEIVWSYQSTAVSPPYEGPLPFRPNMKALKIDLRSGKIKKIDWFFSECN